MNDTTTTTRVLELKHLQVGYVLPTLVEMPRGIRHEGNVCGTTEQAIGYYAGRRRFDEIRHVNWKGEPMADDEAEAMRVEHLKDFAAVLRRAPWLRTAAHPAAIRAADDLT